MRKKDWSVLGRWRGGAESLGHSGDHKPAHAHVVGGGPETKIGANGKKLDGEATPTGDQQNLIDENLAAIRSAINKIKRWLAYQDRPD